MSAIKRFFQWFKIDYEKLHKSKTEGLFWLDILMILLIAFNLSWIVFEYGFQYQSFQNIIEWISPAFYTWYLEVIHPDFFVYDLIFVGIFILELLFRWTLAVVKKTHEKWFFYPFIHWYDVLGCIPLSTFRALRLLRVFSMMYRLQRRGIIDMTSTAIYRQLNRYLLIFTEEVSDRVVINILNGVQDEVSKGSPIVERIIREVLLPKQHIIATWMARRLGVISVKTFENNEAVVRRVIEDALAASLRNNKEVARLKLIPGAGSIITDILHNSVTDVTFNTIKSSIIAFSEPQNNAGLINDASHYLMEALIEDHEQQDQSLDDIVSAISVEVLELIKEEVAVRQWKLAEEERKELKRELRTAP
jgi:hypothetical protein